MIQRIQSFWLLLATICAFLTIQFSFYSGNRLLNGQPAFLELTGKTAPLYLLILSVAAGLGALISIFLYKDRKTQLRLVLVTLLVSLANIALYILEIKNFENGSFTLTSIFVFAVPLFLLLAIRGIYKDQRLIKSLDRLR